MMVPTTMHVYETEALVGLARVMPRRSEEVPEAVLAEFAEQRCGGPSTCLMCGASIRSWGSLWRC